MKKVIRSIAVVAIMIASASSTAQETTLSVTPDAEKSLTLEMDAPSEETVIRISDTKGVVMFTETSSGVKSYSKKFDLKNLPDGDYFLIVEDLLKETIFEFDINDSKALVAEMKENVKPLFKKDGKKVFLNLLNTDKEKVEITIYDSEDRTVFNEELEDVILNKAFNFENAYANNYTVVVKTAQKSYSENILIK